MKGLLVTVEIWAVSNTDFDEADVIFIKQFKVKNFKIQLSDFIANLSRDCVKSEYPNCKYIGHKILRYS